MEALIANARYDFHDRVCSDNILTRSWSKKLGEFVFSNADSGNAPSRQIAALMAEQLEAQGHSINTVQQKMPGQTAGTLFEIAVAEFVNATFPKLQALRPGYWGIKQLGNQSTTDVSDFAQYEHLAELSQLKKANPTLQAALGNDYVVSPDVIVWRNLVTDEEINADRTIVDERTAIRSVLRKTENNTHAILHASISAKFTMRSDRAQNSRTEALNLIRNRNGHLPHIVVVTAEPHPSRLASLALGTGDIDCVYHFALTEWMDAIETMGNDIAIDMMHTLVLGKRLKDISDLPLDLAV